MLRLALVAVLLPALIAPARAKTAPAVLAPTVPATIASPLPGDPMGVTIHRLPNGLTVYLSPNKGQPRITAHIAVRTGSKNDPADATGQAHYLEHMVFKGTTRIGTLDYAKEAPHLARIRDLYEARAKTKDAAARARIDKEIDAENQADAEFVVTTEIGKFYRSIGISGLNAYTENDSTVYVADVPSNRLDAWATVEAERFSHPVFRLFPGELEAVYEEKNTHMDSPASIVWETLMKGLFKAHPYGTQTTIGTIEHLKNPSLATMQAFYDRWYVPNNMAIVLAGDFDREAALEIIRKRFGSWTPKALPAPQTWPLPKPKGEERYEVKFEDEDLVLAAWPTVTLSNPDADALTVMDMVMDNAAAGLMNLRLNQAQKVKGSGSHPTFMTDAGYWEIWATPKKGQTPEEALALVDQTIEALKNGDFAASDLDAIITDFEINEKRGLESNSSRVGTMVRSFVAFQPWERTSARLARLRAVTKDDVVRVARQYLGPDRVVVFRRNGKQSVPKIEKPGFTALKIDPSRQSAFIRELSAVPATPIEPRWLTPGKDYQIVPVEGGRLYAAKNPYNDLFELTLRYDRGTKSDRRLCKALELLELSGAGPYSAEEFKRKLYALGTTLTYGCGEQESSVTLSGVDRNFWPSLELMAQRFDWPNVSSGTLERMIEVDLGEREDEKKNPEAVEGALGELAMRGRESPVLARLTNDELKRLNQAALLDAIRDFPRWQRRVGYVGPRTPNEVAKLLEGWGRYKATPARVPLKLLRPAKPRILFTHRDMNQARAGLFLADEPFDPEHSIDYSYYTQYMGGGFSSVVFQQVREARSLAYHADAGHARGLKGDDTQVWGEIACQADKTPEALELMSRLIKDFPVNEKAFRETAKSIEESYRGNPIQFRAVPGALMSWEDQGITGGDPRPRNFEKALKYTPAQLESFAKRWKDKPLTIWILGQRDRVDADKLKALGDFEEKSLGDLFPY